MSQHDLSETGGALAYATDAVVAALSARLDALVASWQLAIEAKRKAPVRGDSAATRSSAEVLMELERELADLERRCSEQRKAAETEFHEAEEWERRAMEAVRNDRDDVARHALTELASHTNSAARLDATAAELETLRDSYRNAVTAVRATTTGTATT